MLRLYNAPPSYYSMIARLALVEAHRPFESVVVDIHRRGAHLAPEYARKNPHLTIPTLERDGLPTLTESRDIVRFALGEEGGEEERRLVDLQYAFPIEELTFGWLLDWNPLLRKMVPRGMASNEARLRRLADENPDLRALYLARAEVFAGRRRAFDPAEVSALYRARRRQAIDLLDGLEETLRDGRPTLLKEGYGPSDVVWTVFLARMFFIRHGGEVERRPRLARYAKAMFARPSFDGADVWKRVKPLAWLKQVL